MDQIVNFISYVALISIATERIVELLKRSFLEKMNVNKAIYPIMSFTIGVEMSVSQPHSVQLFNFNQYVIFMLTGLIVSYGSGLINEILTALNQFNKLHKPVKTNTP